MKSRGWQFSLLSIIMVAALSACSPSPPPDEKPKGPPAPAKVKVQQLEAMSLDGHADWKDIPPYLANAKIYANAKGNESNRLQLEAESGGVIVVAAMLTYVKSASGAKRETGLEDGIMIMSNFVPIGQMNRVGKDGSLVPHRLYRRKLEAGDKLDLDIKNQNPALLVLPAADRAQEILAAKPLKNPDSVARRSVRSGGEPSLFQDLPGNGAVLVGLRVTLDRVGEYRTISSVQPLYETSQGSRAGQVHGESLGTVVEVLAKPGYAVGGIVQSYSENDELAGFGVVFLRRTATGLDLNSAYYSRWIGNDLTTDPVAVKLSESTFVGIRGKWNNGIQSVEPVGVGEK